MIASALFILGTAILQILVLLGSFVTYIMPDQFIDGIQYFLGFVMPFNGIFPVTTVFACAGAIITAWLVIGTFKFGLWLVGFIPFVNQNTMPVITSHSESTTTRNGYPVSRTVSNSSRTSESSQSTVNARRSKIIDRIDRGYKGRRG